MPTKQLIKKYGTAKTIEIKQIHTNFEKRPHLWQSRSAKDAVQHRQEINQKDVVDKHIAVVPRIKSIANTTIMKWS